MAAGWQGAVQRRSAALAVFMGKMPRSIILVVLIGLVLGGLWAPGVLGMVLLLVLAVFGGWLMLLGWEHRSAAEKALRMILLGALVAAALSKILV